MNVTVVIHHRFATTPDGGNWTSSIYPYHFWTRYLAVFEGVNIVARTQHVQTAPAGACLADGPGVKLLPLPYFIGPLRYLFQAHNVNRALRRGMNPSDAVILRVSSHLAELAASVLRQSGHPFGVEVVGDPFDEFAPGANTNPFRPFFRWLMPRRLRRQCLDACACAYVTERALQQRYPARRNVFLTHYSSIDLHDRDFAPSPRTWGSEAAVCKVICVASMAQMYKGVDVLLQATSLASRGGVRLELTVVGDGVHRAAMEGLARHLGISGICRFTGTLSGPAAVKEQLDASDMFVLPSRTEGLPRAILEAMARALPCIATNVGGIPELLDAGVLVPPNEPGRLAEKMSGLAADRPQMGTLSARNLNVARRYEHSRLQTRRNEFYGVVRNKTLEWSQGASASGRWPLTAIAHRSLDGNA